MKGGDWSVQGFKDKSLEICLLEVLIGEISIKVLQEILLKGIPVGSMIVLHALDDLLYMDGTVLKDRLHLLSVSGDMMKSTKAFIVSNEGLDIGVLSTELLWG